MAHLKRRDWVAKNMRKFNHGGAHKSKKAYNRKSKHGESYEDIKEDLEAYRGITL